jgi:ADP-ribose pyrophosphatase YjhB (NUDIX family)
LIRQFLERIWRLPWPYPVRRLASDVARLPVISAVLFPHFMIGVVGIIRDEAGNILLLHHTYRETPWGLPTGFLERGEQPIDALSREIMEEAGLEVILAPEPVIYAEPSRPLLNIVYQGRFVGGQFEASAEVSQARWFPLDALPPMLDSQRELIMTSLKEVTNERPDGERPEFL